MTKSSNWEIITENLVKDKMRLRMKNLNIFGVYWKIWLLGKKGEGSRKTNIEGGMPKKGELGQFANLSGGGGGRGVGRKSKVAFLMGGRGGVVDTPMHTTKWDSNLQLSNQRS